MVFEQHDYHHQLYGQVLLPWLPVCRAAGTATHCTANMDFTFYVMETTGNPTNKSRSGRGDLVTFFCYLSKSTITLS